MWFRAVLVNMFGCQPLSVTQSGPVSSFAIDQCPEVRAPGGYGRAQVAIRAIEDIAPFCNEHGYLGDGIGYLSP